MENSYCYDVTKWEHGDPYQDIGAVLNDMIRDIKNRQQTKRIHDGGCPGAVISIPPGDYRLKTQVLIDISYLRIQGFGHGFTSSSIRFNTPLENQEKWHELWPGGSRILVELENTSGDEAAGAAFYVHRSGNPRISSVEFVDFCIDGVHFEDDGSGIENAENTYTNGKTGIYVEDPQDSFKFRGMGLVYLEHGLVICHADALSIHENFIAECGNCIELREDGQASKITDNLLGAGYKGYTIFAQNFGGLLISANNVFPRGASSVYFDSVARSSITANRIHAFYPGMVVFEKNCIENLIASNHFLRDCEPWEPMLCYDNGREDAEGLFIIRGKRNTISGNHISETIDPKRLKPFNAVPVIFHIEEGTGNYIAGNHIVVTAEEKKKNDAVPEDCFYTQVEAIVSIGRLDEIPFTAVLVDEDAVANIVLDTGNEEQVVMNRGKNSFRGLN